jgi:hypothetical protein
MSALTILGPKGTDMKRRRTDRNKCFDTVVQIALQVVDDHVPDHEEQKRIRDRLEKQRQVFYHFPQRAGRRPMQRALDRHLVPFIDKRVHMGSSKTEAAKAFADWYNAEWPKKPHRSPKTFLNRYLLAKRRDAL